MLYTVFEHELHMIAFITMEKKNYLKYNKMGGSQSTEKTNATVEDRLAWEIILDKDVKKEVETLSKYVSAFNNDNAQDLLEIIKNYKSALNSSSYNYDLKPIEAFVQNFHGELLKSIEQDKPGMDEASKSTELRTRLKDRKLPAYLKSVYDKNLQGFFDDVMKSELLENNPGVKGSVQDIFTNITTMKSKYKFFEYKYIQLNLFVLIFIQHTFETMDHFVSSIIAYTMTRDKVRQDSLKELVELLVRIMNQAELTIRDEDFAVINNMMSMVETQIKDKKTNLDQAVTLAKEGAMKELLQFVITNANIFSEKELKSFEGKAPKNIFMNNASPSTTAASSFESLTTPFQVVATQPAANSSKSQLTQHEAKQTNANASSSIANALKKQWIQQETKAANATSGMANSTKKTWEQQEAKPTNAPSGMANSSKKIWEEPEQKEKRPNSGKEVALDELDSEIKRGGFVRGSSTFPQSFFELTST